jgi:hypothetical protein
MRDPKLSSTFRYILAATLPVAAGLAACGGGTSESSGGPFADAAADAPDIPLCGKCGCNPPPVPPTHTVAWTPDCNETSDGGADASDDASTDASTLSPMECLWQKCNDICEAHKNTGANINATCKVLSEDAGAETIECSYVMICGRRPAGLEAMRDMHDDAIGRYLASSAFLEAASVEAFAILADDLLAHGAPARLVRAARKAARDEVRHADVMAALASRLGAQPEPVTAAKRTPRTLEEIAIENAKEGCVRETYGALLATWQGSAARDVRVRAAMRRIARDETRHAELAWAVARWADTRLSQAARHRVEDARRAAANELIAELAMEPAAELVAELGLPRAEHAQAAARAMDALLWQQAA